MFMWRKRSTYNDVLTGSRNPTSSELVRLPKLLTSGKGGVAAGSSEKNNTAQCVLSIEEKSVEFHAHRGANEHAEIESRLHAGTRPQELGKNKNQGGML